LSKQLALLVGLVIVVVMVVGLLTGRDFTEMFFNGGGFGGGGNS